MKAIFHIDELSKWNFLIDNIMSMIRYLEESDDSFDIVLLVNGEAVVALNETVGKNLGIHQRLHQLNDFGVHVEASQTSIEKYDISLDKLYDFVLLVPSGGLELTIKMNAGYAYLKP